jgi:PPOX class probable F420-dependent enzyme
MSEQQVSVYPQAHAMTSEEMESFLARPLIAKLCTHNPDGSIHIVPIWFRYANGEILLGTQEITQKVQNIKRDNRVTVLVDTTEPRLGGVIMTGAAELDYEEVIPTRTSIFAKYMDAEAASALAARLAKQWQPVIVRIKPQRVITFDYSKGFGLSASPDAPSMEIA